MMARTVMDAPDRKAALNELLRHFPSQVQMAEAIGMTGPIVNYWEREHFALEPRLRLLALCVQRGLAVDCELVLGRDMLGMIRKIAAASKAPRRRPGAVRRGGSSHAVA